MAHVFWIINCTVSQSHSLYNQVFRNFALSLLFPVIIGGKENSRCILMQILSANLLHTQRSASSDNRFRQVPAVNLERKAKEHRLVVKFHSIERHPRSIHNWNQFVLFVTVEKSLKFNILRLKRLQAFYSLY